MPSASVRSTASRTASYNSAALDDVRRRVFGRFDSRRSASRETVEVTNRVRSPLRSSSALVATVVPILMAFDASGGIASPAAVEQVRRMPSRRRRVGLGGRQQLECGTSAPSGRPTTSVKVPPRSIQNVPRSYIRSLARHGRQASLRSARSGSRTMPARVHQVQSRYRIACDKRQLSRPAPRNLHGDVRDLPRRKGMRRRTARRPRS